MLDNKTWDYKLDEYKKKLDIKMNVTFMKTS